MARFELSDLTKSVIRYLASHRKGEHVTYVELGRIVGMPMRRDHSSVISARRVLQREHAQVWGCVKSVGLWRLNDAEIAERQRGWYIFGARRKLKAAAAQAEVVETGELTLDQQARFATDGIIRELGQEALSRAMQRRIEKVARGTSNDLPSFNVLEWAIALSPRKSTNV